MADSGSGNGSDTSCDHDSDGSESEEYESDDYCEQSSVITSSRRYQCDESGYFSRQKLGSADSEDAVGSDLDVSVRSQEQIEMSLKLKKRIPEALKALKTVHETDISTAWRANWSNMEKEKEQGDQENTDNQPKIQAVWDAKSFDDDTVRVTDPDSAKTFVYDAGRDEAKVSLIRKHIMKPTKALPHGSYWVQTDQNLRVKNSASGREGQLGEDLRDLNREDIRKLASTEVVGTPAEAEKKIEHDALLKQLESPDVFVALVNELLKIETPDLEGKPTYEIVHQSEVFKAISNFYGGGQAVFPYVLEQKYLRLEKIVPEERPLPSVPKSGDRAAVLKRFHSKFCRRCFTYGCLIHATDMDNLKIRENLMQEPVRAERSNARPPCSLTCNKVARLEKSNGTRMGREASEEADSWSQDEKAIFLFAGRVFQNDSCRLAEVIKTKNCSEVTARLQWMAEEGQSFPSSGTPTVVPGKVLITTTMSSFSSYAKNHQLLLGVGQNDRPTVPPCYYPCDHEGPCESNSAKCQCYSNNIPCEKYCRCYFGKRTCRNIFPGCKCIGTCGPNCDCSLALRECDIDICGCKDMTKLRKDQVQKGNDSSIELQPKKLQGCKNSAIQFKHDSRTIRLLSPVAGWGLFASNDIPANQLVGEYCGELVSVDESERRGQRYDSQGTTYLFNRDTDTTIDGMHFANVTRYINSAPEENANCYPLCKNVAGTLRIGLYAKKYIKTGEELFFDYQQALNIEKEQETQTVSSKYQTTPGRLPTSTTKKTVNSSPCERKRVPSAKKQTTVFPANPLRLLMKDYDIDEDEDETSSSSE